MTESGHEKIARRLRELAERIEREPLPAGTAGRTFSGPLLPRKGSACGRSATTRTWPAWP